MASFYERLFATRFRVKELKQQLSMHIANNSQRLERIVATLECVQNSCNKLEVWEEERIKEERIKEEHIKEERVKDNAEYETSFYKANARWDEVKLPEDYVNLIRGLDQDSITILSAIVARLMRWKHNSYACKTLWTPDEILALQQLEIELNGRLIKFSDECYAYGQYLLPIQHFESSVFYYRHGIDTVRNLAQIRQKCIVDVGGFVGDSALVFSEYTDGKVYSFEPSKTNFALMEKTLELNKCENIIPVQLGLGERKERLYLKYQESATLVCDKDQATETIEVTTLDAYVQEHGLNVGLIKVDTEGHEQPFLRGAEQTIRTQKPVLLISIYHNMPDFFHIKPMLESWNLGYSFRVHKPIDGSVALETLLIAEPGIG